jgi:cytoskeletal protein RodZ
LPSSFETQYNIAVMSVAEQLRQAREARHLTVEQVAEITKIRTDHLRALEEGNFDVFSAPVYIRGFVRSLSTLLKLDVPGMMATLDAELAKTQQFAEPPPLMRQRQGFVDFLMLQLSRVDWQKGVWVLGAAVVLATVLLVIVVSRNSRRDPLKGVKPAVYQPTRSNSGETLPLPTPKR